MQNLIWFILILDTVQTGASFLLYAMAAYPLRFFLYSGDDIHGLGFHGE